MIKLHFKGSASWLILLTLSGSKRHLFLKLVCEGKALLLGQQSCGTGGYHASRRLACCAEP